LRRRTTIRLHPRKRNPRETLIPSLRETEDPLGHPKETRKKRKQSIITMNNNNNHNNNHNKPTVTKIRKVKVVVVMEVLWLN